MDLANGEVAFVACCTRSKYYKDASSSKQYTNHIVSSLPNLNVKKLFQIKMPIIQILGMSCHIRSMNLKSKQSVLVWVYDILIQSE